MMRAEQEALAVGNRKTPFLERSAVIVAKQGAARAWCVEPHQHIWRQRLLRLQANDLITMRQSMRAAARRVAEA
jgi:hypothetical protein